MNKPILTIKDLRVHFNKNGDWFTAVDGVSLELRENEIFALVGESGSGKSALALAVTGLHNKNFTKIEGSIWLRDVCVAPNTCKRRKAAVPLPPLVFQDPLSALNPLMKIGAQIEEALIYGTNLSKTQRKTRVLELLSEVGLKDPQYIYSRLPHELSGGMRQRVVIAMAVSCKPEIIIADEPTTALDVTIQAQILKLLKKLQRETKAAILLITHDLGVVSEIADRVGVMYAGKIVETSSVDELFDNPRHTYTRSLLELMI
ncbi:MAG: ABC transporter ATP-binding protein [Defluviitaleaceae bacterium]|nr:ABC transporter ATP-binding protein [Defluviitaleaceae bacterium]